MTSILLEKTSEIHVEAAYTSDVIALGQNLISLYADAIAASWSAGDICD